MPNCTLPACLPAPAARLEASGAALDALKRTAVYHDVFRIWYDGACGTISGLRLGRTSQQVGWVGIAQEWACVGWLAGQCRWPVTWLNANRPAVSLLPSLQAVEWDEINAAWGQAVLLLATLAKVLRAGARAARRGGCAGSAVLVEPTVQPKQHNTLVGWWCAS